MPGWPGGFRPRRLVAAELFDALAALDLDGNDLRIELSRCLCRAETLLGTLCPSILGLACDLHPGDEILGVPSRMLTGEGVVQPIEQHAVIDLGVTHPVAPASSVHEIGRSVHILHATGDRHIGLTKPNLLGGGDDGLGAGSANAIYGHRRHGDRQSAADGGLPRRIHPVAGLDDVAHDDRINTRAVQACPAERFPNGGRAELGRGHALERAVIGPDPGADRFA